MPLLLKGNLGYTEHAASLGDLLAGDKTACFIIKLLKYNGMRVSTQYVGTLMTQEYNFNYHS